MTLLRGILTLSDLALEGRRVLVRADLDVAVSDDTVVDDARIRAALPTLRAALEAGAKLIVAAHLGPPSIPRSRVQSLEPIGSSLSSLTGCEVHLPDDCIGDAAKKVVQDLRPGQICLLENLRFYPEEEADDVAFAEKLAELGDVYVNDALRASAERHASVHALARAVRERGAGLALENELRALERLTQPERPYVAVLGGAALEDKLSLVNALMAQLDVLCVGGAVANTFLAARGIDVRDSRYEKDKLAAVRTLLERMQAHGVTVLLPDDVVVAPSARSPSGATVAVSAIPEGTAALDIGPKTVAAWALALGTAKTILWTGPLGAVENPAFAEGTARFIEAFSRSPAFKVVLGHDSAVALRQAGGDPPLGVQHISDGGRASLDVLQGKKLPGLEALRSTQRSSPRP
jgi:phosphoglycerate kinase